MEAFIADLINNPKVPKWLRYVIVTRVCGFVIFLGFMLAMKSTILVGIVFGGVLSVLFLAAGVYLFEKITQAHLKQ